MSAIEYNSLLFQISQRLDELNVLDHLLFMCRGKLATGSEDNIPNVLSLLKKLEDQKYLGNDRLEVLKDLLKGVRAWPLFAQVEKFERKRKEYNSLIDQIIRVIDELDDKKRQRLIAMCRKSYDQNQDVRSLFKLAIDRLDILKGILTETEQSGLLKEVEKFEERRKREDDLERRKAQLAAVGDKLKGALTIKTVFTLATGGVIVLSVREILKRASTFDQLATAFASCVLPAATTLIKLREGSLCLTVRAETLSALTTLWKLYQDGTLKTRLYNFFVTDEVRERAGGEEVEVNVTIDEQEYEKACLDLIKEAQEDANFGDEKRIRRNSDSAVYLSQKEEMPLFLKRAKTEWEARSRGETAAVFSRTNRQKAHKAGKMEVNPDEPEISQRMDPGKFASVQRFLDDEQDVQETHSMTTGKSDSDYWTEPTVSELGFKEPMDTPPVYLEDKAYDGIRNPYVLVINNENFYNSPHPRDEARYDRKNVKKFVKEAGFKYVEEYLDLPRKKMLKVLKQAQKHFDLDNQDSFICIIMSHENEEGILGIDEEPISVEDITAMFQGDLCPQLDKKPKLFFFQVSRAEDDDEWYYKPRRRQRHLSSRMPETLFLDPDCLIAYSSTTEHELPRRGSPFISCLMRVLRANSHKEDLMTMLTRVNKAMSELTTGDERRQMSFQFSTLTKKVYFPNFQK